MATARADAQAVAGPGRWVDSIFAPYDKPGLPGCAVGVIQKGALVYSRGYGEADLFRRMRNTPETAFYLASLSKQFTAMSVVLLAQEGKLALTDDVRRWVPEVPKLGAITLLDLLQHTSGLRDYFTLLGINGWRSNELLTERELLDLVSRQKALNFPAGEEFLYSNTGYALLSVVVRRASGQTLRDFAADRIFKPLGMTNTQFRDDHTSRIEGEAIGYLPQNGRYSVSIPQLDVVGDGGVFSTVGDLARWDGNLDSGIVGGKDGVKLLLTAGTLRDGRSTGYALGLNIGSFNGSRLVSHSGSYGGYHATYLRFPDDRMSVIALCNVATSSSQLAEQVASVYMPQAYRAGDAGSSAFAASFGPLTLSSRGSSDVVGPRGIQEPDEQVWLEGKYFSDELEMEVNLRSRDAVLVMVRPIGENLRFARIARDLFLTSDQITLQVERDASGVVSGFLLSTGRVRGLRFVKRTGILGPGWGGVD
jgi:CubicO group peptidase (beta-lactamase class C family)